MTYEGLYSLGVFERERLAAPHLLSSSKSASVSSKVWKLLYLSEKYSYNTHGNAGGSN